MSSPWYVFLGHSKDLIVGGKFSDIHLGLTNNIAKSASEWTLSIIIGEFISSIDASEFRHKWKAYLAILKHQKDTCHVNCRTITNALLDDYKGIISEVVDSLEIDKREGKVTLIYNFGLSKTFLYYENVDNFIRDLKLLMNKKPREIVVDVDDDTGTVRTLRTSVNGQEISLMTNGQFCVSFSVNYLQSIIENFENRSQS